MPRDLTRDILSDSLIARFRAKVDIRGVDECWPWTACRTPVIDGFKGPHGGYGRIGFTDPLTGRWKQDYSHRIAYLLNVNSDIPATMLIMHSCDNPGCCNPKHLILGTYSQNSQDREDKNRSPKDITHRAKKYPLTPEQIKQIGELYLSGMTIREVATHFGIGAHPAIVAIRRAGVPAVGRGGRPRKTASDKEDYLS